jgi:hypothetical protein
VPNLIIQASADWKWWVGFTSAPFSLTPQGELIWTLSPKKSIELVCRFIARTTFIPGHLGSARAEANIRSFFEHDILLHTPYPTAVNLETKITKKLILEREPLSVVFGIGAATGLSGFRDHLNRCGANFPDIDEWMNESEMALEPILQWTLAPFPYHTPLSDAA